MFNDHWLLVRLLAYLKLHSSLKKAFEAFRQLKVSFKKTESHWAGKTLRILFRKNAAQSKLWSRSESWDVGVCDKKFEAGQNFRPTKTAAAWNGSCSLMIWGGGALEDGRKIVRSKRSNVSHHHRRHQEIILKTAWKVLQRPQIQATDPWKSINDGSWK